MLWRCGRSQERRDQLCIRRSRLARRHNTGLGAALGDQLPGLGVHPPEPARLALLRQRLEDHAALGVRDEAVHAVRELGKQQAGIIAAAQLVEGAVQAHQEAAVLRHAPLQVQPVLQRPALARLHREDDARRRRGRRVRLGAEVGRPEEALGPARERRAPGGLRAAGQHLGGVLQRRERRRAEALARPLVPRQLQFFPVRKRHPQLLANLARQRRHRGHGPVAVRVQDLHVVDVVELRLLAEQVRILDLRQRDAVLARRGDRAARDRLQLLPWVCADA
mmetsp:Transcript_22175/g.66581  ORF Transcript_22175/g.66581 Transcript_22175/m.66581 type:complete len:278 (+) Transcript_22175:20-853(+)